MKIPMVIAKVLRGKGENRKGSATRFKRLILLVVAVGLAAAGCYEVDQEVILASSAVSVYGLPGTYTGSSGKTTISAVPNSNDYRFQDINKENKVSTGYLRVVPLHDTIYIVQVKYDNEAVYYISFYKFTVDASGNKDFVQLEAPDDQVTQLAQKHGVGIVWGFIPMLSGSRTDIMSFLYAHKGLSLSPATY